MILLNDHFYFPPDLDPLHTLNIIMYSSFVPSITAFVLFVPVVIIVTTIPWSPTLVLPIIILVILLFCLLPILN